MKRENSYVFASETCAFDIIGGFEMHLNPLDWNQRKLILFVVFFILTAVIESFFIKKKK